MQEIIRLGMVGLGSACVVGHLPLWLKMRDQVQVVALCDVNQETLQMASRRLGISKVYTNVNEMLKQERLDAIDICTPPLTHKELCLSALRKNVNCIVEKPVVTSLAEIDELIAFSKEMNLGIFVIQNQSFSPILRKARALIHGGEIGDILQVDVTLSIPVAAEYADPNHWAHKEPGGPLGEIVPHPGYMLVEFLGREIKEVVSQMIRRGSYPFFVGDELKVLVRTDNALGSLSVSLNSPTRKLMVNLIGSKLWVSIDVYDHVLVKYLPIPCGRGAILRRGQRSLSEISQRVGCLTAVSANVFTGRYRTSEGHRYLFHQIVEALRGQSVYPIKLETVREEVKVLEAAFSKK